MDDLTILYYTANHIDELFAINVRNHLLSVIDNIPIISISHLPIDFGHNICVGQIDYSTYSIYKQILIGAMCASTLYVACCEDDALYNQEHFTYRPPSMTFGYNTNKWHINPDTFFYRARINMTGCIVETALMVEVLCKRYAKYPKVLTPAGLHGWGEPGRKDNWIGLEKPAISTFTTNIPIITFNHRDSTGGRRGISRTDILKTELDGIGYASDIWNKFYQ